MKIRKTRTVKFRIELDQEEAKMLASLIQDPVCNPEDEPEEYTDFRERLFNALKDKE